ncbi:MAG: acetyltransferase [Gammaproteobacteria bacterium]|nr:acetyltransferase [Gammaproteobacteria bacterium]
MFLKQRSSGHLIEVLTLPDLFDPYRKEVIGRSDYGEEAQEPETVKKSDLVFPSGETLPRCWTDAHYRDDELTGTRPQG